MTVATSVVNGQLRSYRLDGDPLKVPGNARIYRVIGRKDVLYKEFGEPLAGAKEIRRIEELVSAGAEFGGAELSSSRGRIAWPRDAVIEEDEILGVITPYAGDEFYNAQIGKRLMPRHLTYLRTPEEGVPVEIRLRLMRQLAGVLALLEHADLVHGDVAAQNVLWKPAPRPSIFLIDCDGMHSDSVEGNDGSTEGWADPRKEEDVIASQDMLSDWFALALAVWRVTTLSMGTPEHGPDGVVLPPEIPRPFRSLLVRTFEDVMDPDPRPSPGEWVEALDEVLGSSRAQRGLNRLVPSPPTRPRAQRPSPPRARTPKTTPRPAPAVRARSTPRRRWPLKRILVSTLLLACLVVIGAPFLNAGSYPGQIRAEKAVAHWSRPLLRGGRVTADCPRDSSLHVGARYRCRVESRGGAVARVRVRVNRGGKLRRSINLFAFRQRALVRGLRADYRYLRRRGLDWGLKDVSCPRTVSANSGTRFQCAAKFTDGADGKIVGHMRSPRGYYSWREAGTDVAGLNSALR